MASWDNWSGRDESEWKETRWEERRDNGDKANTWKDKADAWRETDWREAHGDRQNQWLDSSRESGWREDKRTKDTWQEPAREAQSGDPWHDSGDPWGGTARQPATSSTSPAPGRWQEGSENTSADVGRIGADSSWNVDAPAFQPAAAENPANQWQSWDTGSAPQGHEALAQNAMANWDGKSPCSLGTPQQHARQRDFKSYQDWNLAQNVLPQDSQADVEDEVEQELFKLGLGQGAGIDFSLYDEVACTMSGEKIVPGSFPEIKAFADIRTYFPDSVPAELEHNISRCAYDKPTPVQRYSIPVGLAGRDVMCCAQTGSGKTVAFLVPILASMIKNHRSIGNSERPFEGPCKPDTLILSPTRELCVQIYRETLKFCHKTPFRAVRVYGQEDARKQIEQVAKGADIVVATPGRLWDFVNSGILQVTQVECLVIDEADIMVSKQMDGFIKDVVENYGMPPKEERQTMMFSATFPAEIQIMASNYLYQHVWIGIGPVGGASSTVTQSVVQVEHEKKFDKLADQLLEFLDEHQGERLIVFTNTKMEAKGLDDKLWDMKVNTGALHGELSQTEREENLKKFRNGDIEVLVATDLAARGLDIGGVTHVINYDVPRDIDTYVQRIGRTGRIGRRGFATTYITTKDGTFIDDASMLKEIVKKMEESGSIVPDWLLQANAEQNKDSWNTWDQSKQYDARATEVSGWNQDSKQEDQASGWDQDSRQQDKGSWSSDWQ